MKKRIISLILVISLIFSFAGCVDLEDTYSSSIDSTYSSQVDSVDDKTESSSEETTSSKPQSSTTSTEDKKPTNSVGSGTATAVNLANIPAYSGKAYVAVNNNIPNFSASELTTKGYEKYSNCSGLCDPIGGVDKELPETIAEDRGEYDLGQNAG